MHTETLHDDEYGKIEYKRLPIKDGDVIVVRAGISQDALDQLALMLGSTGREHSIIVAVANMSDIKALDERVMANHGWHRSGRLEIVSKFLEGKIKEERSKLDDFSDMNAAIYDGIYFMLTGKYYE